MSPVQYTLTASILQIGEANEHNLTVTGITFSLDMDRSPYGLATITIKDPGDTVWPLLDPREKDWHFRWDVTGLDPDGVEVARWSAFSWFILDAQRHFDQGTVTIDCSTYETALDERIRNSESQVDTGAANLEALFYWVMDQMADEYPFIGQSFTAAGVDPGGVTLPAGDRRIMGSGETFMNVLEPEFTAAGMRLRGRLATGDGWAITAPDSVVFEGRPTTLDLSDGIAGNLSTFSERVSRTGDWADGVLVKYEWLSVSTPMVAYHRSGSGVNSKGIVITQNRAKPAGNAADDIVARTKLRGKTYEVTGPAHPDVWCAQALTVHYGGSTYPSQIRSFELSFPEGSMTLKAQVQ